MTHADQIRLHLTRLSDAINAGKTLDAYGATSALLALRARMPQPVTLPLMQERAQ